jgi:ABC-type multidrug transport system fused ATPase/permease subunit
VLRLLPIAERRLVVVLVLAALASGVLPLLFTFSIGALIGGIPDVVRDGFDSEAGHTLVWVLAGTTIVFAAMQVIDPVQEALETIGRREIDESLRAKTLEDLSRPRGIGHLEDPRLMDHLVLIREGSLDLGATPGGAAVMTIRMLASYVQGFGGTIIVGAAFSWVAAAGLLAACLLCRRIVRRGTLAYLWVWRGDPEQMRFQRRADYGADLGVGPVVAKESRVFGLTDWLGDRFRSDWGSVMREPAELQGRLLRGGILAYGVLMIAYALVFVFVADAAIAGAIGIGVVALVAQASFDIAELAYHFPWDRELELGTVVLPKVRELESRAARAAEGAGRRTPDAETPSDTIGFERVAFRYPGSDHDVLGGLDLSIRAGRSLAIVGPNGAGKTTLIKLLAGLYEPTAGRIVVDGVDLAEIDPADWQRRIAVIFQDFVRYELPARENVGFGSVAHLGDQATLTAAAGRSGADDVITALPHGWDTVLSRQYTGGADLSGGEWQRIALARCHLAIEAGARILVLDEPTASLDVREEARFFDRFVELTEGLTTILISHRFSTVRAASRIVVLAEGRIVEDGTHEELLALGGRYAEMFRLQAGRYGSEEAS